MKKLFLTFIFFSYYLLAFAQFSDSLGLYSQSGNAEQLKKM